MGSQLGEGAVEREDSLPQVPVAWVRGFPADQEDDQLRDTLPDLFMDEIGVRGRTK